MFNVIRIIILVAFSFCSLLRPLSVLRQCSYKITETTKILAHKTENILSPILVALICFALNNIGVLLNYIILALYSCACVFYYMLTRKTRRKMTKKTLRLIVCYGMLCVPVFALFCFYNREFVLPLTTFPILVISKLVLLPYEKREEKKYERNAMEKLGRIKPKIIAITGSYGKTTFKNVLAHLLGAKYKVCASPKSYNTPQGVCITINDYLKDDDQILLLEMGARYKGDIERLTKLTNPNFCVLTSIGNQHLSTFKTQENLAREKLSIFAVEGAQGFYNSDCGQIPRLPNAISCGKSGRYSYANATKTANGWTFTFITPTKSEQITTSLIADYAPQTVCMALAVAITLDIPLEELKKRANTLKEVAHRQQLLYNGKDVIIDDAYNSNESGFISAVNLLSTFPQRKIIITPGVVELGKSQFAVNEKLASYTSERVDEILCYGVNAKAIKRGGKEKVKAFTSLKSCMNYYETIKGEKAVLFENDLPDCY